MAVPKRKMSRANTHARRSHWKAAVPNLMACQNKACGQPKPPHVACPICGQYAGRNVVTPA